MLASLAPLAQTAPDLSTGAELFRLILSLAAVIGLIFLAGWLSRRFQSGRSGRGTRRMRCLEVLQLGPRERIMLLDVDGQRLVVGASPSGLRALWTGGPNDVPPPMDVPSDGATVDPDAPVGGFRALLHRYRRNDA